MSRVRSRLARLQSLIAVLFCLALSPSLLQSQAPAIPPETLEGAQRLVDAALASSVAWDRLAELVDAFGPRLSGSESLEASLDWILEGMAEDGLDNVRAEPVMVPRWIRGKESVELISPRAKSMALLGLGGSIGTPPQGLRGEVLVVGSFSELEERAAEAQGRIVLFDAPFTTYGETVQYRGRGAVAAAQAGAVASLIRSVTPFSMNTPHTGNMSYQEGVPEIPHAAITLEDAGMLHRMQDRGERIEVLLKMEARSEGMVASRNVMAEIVGWEHPDEVVVLGGHSDSWDVGQGAMDDAGGVVAAWEAVRLMKVLGLRPRRTVRVVGWVAEEMGIFGGQAYARAPGRDSETHVLDIESDGGVFSPLGFGFTGTDEAFAMVQEIARILEPIGAGSVTRGGGGADIGPMMEGGMPGMGLNVESTEYFWYHHTNADTLDKLDPEEVARCVAVMAVMAYVVADLPESLYR
ncbi:MAG: M20/M25/M40 family metallo-hydrolase [Gemmatimonadota bacterium]